MLEDILDHNAFNIKEINKNTSKMNFRGQNSVYF